MLAKWAGSFPTEAHRPSPGTGVGAMGGDDVVDGVGGLLAELEIGAVEEAEGAAATLGRVLGLALGCTVGRADRSTVV
jgi:hypothetical protein